MFTGIAEEVGKILSIENYTDRYILTIQAKKVLEDVKKGDSIMSNGVCLTVRDFSTDDFKAEAMRETLEKTNFRYLKVNDKINLERAMRPIDRFGGHIVYGHVDSLARLIEIRNNYFKFEINDENKKFLIDKGSVAINGISLTITKALDNYFEVSLIEETFKNTNFNDLNLGDLVNIETDILARYIYSFKNNKERMDENFLLKNGF
ncbi:MAG: riboflavin synthase [Tissierellia bacterium]|nr:riboflavin synthase [Tissierellia bacterium]